MGESSSALSKQAIKIQSLKCLIMTLKQAVELAGAPQHFTGIRMAHLKHEIVCDSSSNARLEEEATCR